jgi:hypothetical protein
MPSLARAPDASGCADAQLLSATSWGETRAHAVLDFSLSRARFCPHWRTRRYLAKTLFAGPRGTHLFSSHRSAQHSRTNVARMRRLMSAASTGDLRLLVGSRALFRIRTKHNFVSRQWTQSKVKRGHALEHFVNCAIGTVYEPFRDQVSLMALT